MTFNDDARIDSSKVRRRGRGTGIALGGGGIGVVLILAVLSGVLGIDLTGLAGGGTLQSGPEEEIANCDTGADANASLDCRLAGASDSLDTYWAQTLPDLGVDYVTPGVILFTDAADTGCGGATSAVGPFYCPADQTIYIDTAFYGELTSRFGANEGALSELYVLAHEWGHHVQNIAGNMEGLSLGVSGPGSDGVRLEIQADCFAGAWVGAASSIEDSAGTPFMEAVTADQIRDALSAASAVGDDRIQSATSGQVNPESWTHGSSDQRQRWFTEGLEGGPNACDTFGVPESQL
ncbi:MAG: neutral zinc metallopeptidase [Microbacteriaceae bacterium]